VSSVPSLLRIPSGGSVTHHPFGSYLAYSANLAEEGFSEVHEAAVRDVTASALLLSYTSGPGPWLPRNSTRAGALFVP
jgi:hypothetical protein